MTGFGNSINETDPKTMTDEVKSMQLYGFQPKVRNGKITIEGKFKKEWDFTNNKTHTSYEPE